jgi:hypothetical protein
MIAVHCCLLLLVTITIGMTTVRKLVLLLLLLLLLGVCQAIAKCAAAIGMPVTIWWQPRPVKGCCRRCCCRTLLTP